MSVVDKSIDALPGIKSLQDDALLPVLQNGETFKATGAQVKALADTAAMAAQASATAAAQSAAAAASSAEEAAAAITFTDPHNDGNIVITRTAASV